MIGEDFAGDGFAGDGRRAEEIDFSGGGIGNEDITVGGDREPSGLVEASGQDGDFEAGRNSWLEISRRSDDHRVVGGAPESGGNAGSVAT